MNYTVKFELLKRISFLCHFSFAAVITKYYSRGHWSWLEAQLRLLPRKHIYNFQIMPKKDTCFLVVNEAGNSSTINSALSICPRYSVIFHRHVERLNFIRKNLSKRCKFHFQVSKAAETSFVVEFQRAHLHVVGMSRFRSAT